MPTPRKPGAVRGRPSSLAGGKPVTLYLDNDSLAAARALGKGNVSAGIRKALAGRSIQTGAGRQFKALDEIARKTKTGE